MAADEELLSRIRSGIINFDHDGVRRAVSQALVKGIKTRTIMKALEEGMDEVGRRYEEDEYYLPELIMAAEAMNEAYKILFKDTANRLAGPLVALATVEGDIHDIGKNLMSNYLNALSIRTFDLGVDVSAKDITSFVEKERPSVLALSAMLTTTTERIKDVIDELESKGLRKKVKIIIGGASSNKALASRYGADLYGKDAIRGSRIIKNLFEQSN